MGFIDDQPNSAVRDDFPGFKSDQEYPILMSQFVAKGLLRPWSPVDDLFDREDRSNVIVAQDFQAEGLSRRGRPP